MLDIHQRRAQPQLANPRLAGGERLVTILLEPGFEQLILDRHPAKNRAIRLAAGGRLIGRAEHLADLQPPARAHNDPRPARIAHGIDGRKPADMPHRPDPN